MWSLFRIAVRNVLRNRRRSALTGLAVILGIGALVTIRGFLNGFQDVLVLNLIEGRSGALSIHHPRYLTSEEQAPLTLDLPGDAAFLDRIAAVPGVNAVAPRIAFVAAVSVGDETGFAQVVAVDPRREAAALPRGAEAVVAGRPIAEAGEALLGAEVARGLGAKLGDRVTFLGADRDGVLNAVEARLVGLLSFKQPGDKRVAQVALADADAMLRMGGRVTEVVVRLSGDPQGPALEETRRRLDAALGSTGRAASWSELSPWLLDMILFQRILFGVLAGTVVVVAVTGITNAMLLSVLERVREIGTIMALGVKRRRILLLFLFESGFLGLLGGLAGAAAGALAVALMHRAGIDVRTPGAQSHYLVRPFIGAGEALGAAALAWAGATLSAIWPALRASRLRPVEALAHV